MNREIKLKAWDKKAKCWYKHNRKAYLEYLCVNQDVVVVVEYKPYNGGYSPCGIYQLNNDEIDNLIIVQNTGLGDKNGKEIYEGDIVQNYKNEPMEIVWDNKKASLTSLKIIGNIYENKDLLNKDI